MARMTARQESAWDKRFARGAHRPCRHFCHIPISQPAPPRSIHAGLASSASKRIRFSAFSAVKPPGMVGGAIPQWRCGAATKMRLACT